MDAIGIRSLSNDSVEFAVEVGVFPPKLVCGGIFFKVFSIRSAISVTIDVLESIMSPLVQLHRTGPPPFSSNLPSFS